MKCIKLIFYWSHFKHSLCLPPHPSLSCFSAVFYQLFSQSGNTVLVEGISLHASLPTKKVCKRKKKRTTKRTNNWTIASPTTLSLIGLVGICSMHSQLEFFPKHLLWPDAFFFFFINPSVMWALFASKGQTCQSSWFNSVWSGPGWSMAQNLGLGRFIELMLSFPPLWNHPSEMLSTAMEVLRRLSGRLVKQEHAFLLENRLLTSNKRTLL